MTIVGDKARFAVEYDLDRDCGGNWLYGRVCFWIGGSPIGDLTTGTSLRDFLFSVERLRCERGRRNNPRFADKSAQEIFDLLDGTLFGSGNATYDAIANDEQWARHLLKPEVAAFDQWKIYLVETVETARLIYQFDAQGGVHESALRPGECVDVLDETCRQIDTLRQSV